MDQLEFIARTLMIVAGIVMIVLGGIGNILNILVFTTWCRPADMKNGQRRRIQSGNSPLYLLTSSVANLVVIGYSLTTRILFDGYHFVVTHNTVFLMCKMRYFCLHTFDTISWVCLSMAIYDRYLVSSREVRLRQQSKTRRQTKCIILLIVLLIGIHSIPLLIYYDFSSSGQCFVNSPFYLYYYRYVFQIFMHGIIPIICFSIFGILTYKQLKVIKDRLNRSTTSNLEKQISRMLFLLSIAIVVSAIPYSAENTYYLIFANSSQQQTPLVFFFHILSSILFYVNAVTSFYIYFVSTPNFRSQILKILLCQQDLNRVMNNQVNTITLTNRSN